MAMAGSGVPGAAPEKKRRMARRQRRVLWTAAILLGASLACAGAGVWLYRARRPATYRPGEDNPEITRTLSRQLPKEAPAPRFSDVTVQAGLAGFRTFLGERTSQLPEDMGAGAAWGDFDNDGDDDVVLVSNGGPLNAPGHQRAPSVLFQNLGNGMFQNVEAFPETRIIGMGAAWGDYNRDGRLDLVLTGYNTLILFRNEGGRFVRDRRLPEPKGFWAGATWGDFDNDGDLDLYVCGYVRYVENPADRARASEQYGKAVPFTLNPASYAPERNLLFRNNGDGTFVEVAEKLGVANPEGRSLSALWHDFNEDGWLDLYVANDISDNVLYLNRRGRFQDASHAAWVADYRGAMGLAAADWNRDGDDDLFISHWVAQQYALYDSLLQDTRSFSLPDKQGLRFMDVAEEKGIGQVSLQSIGWGAEFGDFDGDGWLDLAVANGSTFETEQQPRRLIPQPSFLFWNRRGEFFLDLAPGSEVLSTPRVSRGLALSDYDNDGDLDILVVDRDGGARLLRNDMQAGNWLQLRLRNRTGPAMGFGEGSKIVAYAGDARLRRSVTSASYLSQSSRALHLGLGPATRVEKLEVHWLGGQPQTYQSLDANGILELREGEPAPRRVGASPDRLSGAAGSANEKERLIQFWAKQREAVDAMKIQADLPRAIRLFREALSLNPAHEDARFYLGNCLALQGDVPGALAEFEALTRINPQSHRAYRRWGALRASTASTRAHLLQARQSLEKALAINPEETGTLFVLAEIDLLEGNDKSAQQRLEWICRTNARSAGGFFLRGHLAWKRKDTSEARRLLAETRTALGSEWKPKGAVAEGDVRSKMHREETLLSRFWEQWDGSPDPARAYAPLDSHLTAGSGRFR
jgi:tetratricopeptide (TPR) repeat protein